MKLTVETTCIERLDVNKLDSSSTKLKKDENTIEFLDFSVSNPIDPFLYVSNLYN
jgi:hypothetical protein